MTGCARRRQPSALPHRDRCLPSGAGAAECGIAFQGFVFRRYHRVRRETRRDKLCILIPRSWKSGFVGFLARVVLFKNEELKTKQN